MNDNDFRESHYRRERDKVVKALASVFIALMLMLAVLIWLYVRGEYLGDVRRTAPYSSHIR